MTTSLVSRASETEFLHLKELEITLKDRQPRYPVEVKLAHGEAVTRSGRFMNQDGNSLHWQVDLHLSPESALQVIIKESQTFKWLGKRRDFASVQIGSADIGENKIVTKEDERGLVVLKLVFETPVEAGVAVRKESADAAKLLKKKPIGLEKLGRARRFVETLKKFGDAIGDIHPAAKAATIAFDMLYESFEKQEKVHKDASELIDDLQDFLPFTEVIDSATLANKVAKQAIKDFLGVFKEACEFIVHYSSKGILGDMISSRGSKVNELKSDFKRAKRRYDWSIKTDVWKINLKIEKDRDNDLLKLLQVPSLGPAGREFHRTDRSCLAGTRTSILERISQWSKTTSDKKILWLYGSPGAGKSAIANSVARELEAQRLLAGCFFCKRDDPDLRDINKVIPSLAAHLAIWHQPYRTKLQSILQSEERNKLGSRTLPEQFELLVKRPILGISSSDEANPPDPLIIVIDGLDECGKVRNQRSQLARILVQIADLVSWLKLFVTSRPFPEFNQVFEGSSHLLEKLDLDGDGDPMEDITRFAHHRSRQIAQDEGLGPDDEINNEQITELVQGSRGRFIWMSVAFDFIGSHSDLDYAVGIVLSTPDVDFEKANGDVGVLWMEKLQKAEADRQKSYE